MASKKQLKIAQTLIGIAYNRELDLHLEKLAQKFDDWRKNKIKGYELSDFIHEHHDGISRELFKIYNYSGDKLYLVARAIHLNFLTKDEVPPDLIDLMKNYFKIME